MPRLGCRKVYRCLYEQMRSTNVGRDKLFTILKANGTLIKPHRSYHIMTNSHHRFHKHKNLVENMEINGPEQVFVSDITYVGCRNRHMYLALITDAYSKKIMGFDLSSSLDTKGALMALKMVHSNRMYKDNKTIHHSDRGIQYCSDLYQKWLRKFKLEVCMTESYDPYANAVAERVNGILKQEFLLEEYDLSLGEMNRVVTDAINTYNTKRPHYSCHYLTPEQKHLQTELKIKTYKNHTVVRLAQQRCD